MAKLRMFVKLQKLLKYQGTDIVNEVIFFLPFFAKLDLNVFYSNTYYKPAIWHCDPWHPF